MSRALSLPLATAVPALVMLFIVEGVSVDERIGLTVATALAGLAAAAAVPRVVAAWTTPLWLAAAVGIAMQIRLGAVSPSGAMTMMILAGAAFACAALVSRAISSGPLLPSPFMLAVCAAALLLLRQLPAIAPGGDIESGRLPVPGLGSVQIGEFTRIGLIIIVAFAVDALRRTNGRQRLAAVAALVLVVAQVALLLAVDGGPALLLLIGGVAASVWTVDSEDGRGVRFVTRAPRRVVVVVLATIVVALGLSFFFTNSTLSGYVVDRAIDRIHSLDAPDPQLERARAAVAEGGIIGSGMGSSPLAGLVPEGRSDHAIAVLSADLGVFVVGAMIVAVLRANLTAVSHLAGGEKPGSRAGAALLFVSSVQLTWAALGSFAIAPVTGVSAPWLAATGSALLSTAVGAGIAFGLARAGLPRTTFQADGIRILIAVVVIASVMVAFGSWSRDSLAGSRDRGDILTRDGVVLATGGGATAEYPEGDRRYPLGAETAAVTGRSFALFGSGLSGLESSAIGELTCGGQTPWWSFAEALIHPVPCVPADVVSTIDSHWQAAAAQALSGSTGAAAILDSTTGEVLALVDSTLGDPATWDYGDLPESLATIDAVAPGSVVKPLIAAVAAEQGVDAEDAPREEVEVPGGSVFNSGGARCDDTSLEGAIEQSCNTVFAELALRLGEERLAAGLREHFGADAPSAFDGGVATGLTTGLDGADRAQLARTGIGQESMRATPLGVASAYSALVSSAQGRTPPSTHLVAAVCADGPQVPSTAPMDVVPVAPEAAERALAGMGRAIHGDHGTMRDLADIGRERGMDVAGKSGTAEVPTEVSSSGYVFWATVVVDSRYVITVQVRDAFGVNPATTAAGQILQQMEGDPPSPRCDG
ncbi:hypothetical protein RSA3_03335 [Microbacterium testaceum]|uniref:Penicillin-binding protein transpeptidase domain-containing protein n=1 Tax=Microbacterium testaceum TaxID=2033 RepID=A0A147FAX9_MICTE|nr:hypothetical protein RSA3_03335 [Microbacterium testaceum]